MPASPPSRISLLALTLLAAAARAATIPAEPLEIGHESQFVHDQYVVDTTWGLKPKGEPVVRVLHQAVKHAANPLFGQANNPSLPWVLRESDGRFRMWYQANTKTPGGKTAFRASIAYAESKDGLHWEEPALDLFAAAPIEGLPRNAVIHHAEAPQCTAKAPQIIEALPGHDTRGYRYVMSYTMSRTPLNGIRLVGSQDGIHWDLAHDTLIAKLSSDTHTNIIYDPARQEYALYCRSKHIYRAAGQGREMIDSGESRRGISRMTSRQLWAEWGVRPQTILMPDERDAELGYNFYMAMPLVRRGGIWWAALAPFLWNDLFASELAWSRDGIDFQRLPARDHFIEFGPKGSWDQSMICASPAWAEVGDEWWFYYAGWNGPHDDPQNRTGAIGLATLRKEGFISQHAPKSGGVVCTRALRWPGGDLFINADAHAGELTVRVSDELRKPLKGFDHPDSPIFTGDKVSRQIKWQGRSLDELKGKVIRLEFLLKDADLYTFRAGVD
jgi:hypothetical protein